MTHNQLLTRPRYYLSTQGSNLRSVSDGPKVLARFVSSFADAKELLQYAVSLGGIKITKNNKASTHQQTTVQQS